MLIENSVYIGRRIKCISLQNASVRVREENKRWDLDSGQKESESFNLSLLYICLLHATKFFFTLVCFSFYTSRQVKPTIFTCIQH